MPSLILALLGSPHITRADGSAVTFRSRKELALLVYLAVEGPAAQRRDTLLGLFWPDAPEEAARNSLRVALANLRQALGPAAPTADRQVVQLALDGGALDVVTFRSLLNASRAHRHERNRPCAACAERLAQAVELYRGDFLAGFGLPDAEGFEEWALIRREALHQQALDLLSTLADYYERIGEYAGLCRYARRQLELEPWHEPAQRQLMRGLALAGDRDAALTQYERCRQVLANELGVEPEVETRALYEQIRAGQLTPATRDIAAPRHNLPAALTPFVGRDADLATLRALLAQPGTRLMTLVGAGGMGKTRLALELARASLEGYADGVFFVALAPLADAAGLPAALAQALDLSVQSGEPAAALVRFLRDKHLLLILDNFEHLRDGTAVVAGILEAAPQVQVLVTSRERLKMRGEQLFVVEGLPFADDAIVPDAEASPAVRLFTQSARRAHRDFQIDDQNLLDVRRICRLVQGMPLALELAAAWVELLPLEEIAHEIGGSAGFLAADWADAPARQRSMRAVFEWSWRLLSDAEQQLFRRLAVFRGSFTRAAAEAVVGASLAALAGLVHKSLLRRTDAGATQSGRYEVHELLRQFAAEQLASAPDERAAVEARHSAFYLAFVADREMRLARHEPKQAADEIRGEIDNIRHAWAWAARERRLADLDRSAGGLWQFIFLTGLASEGESAFGLASEQVHACWLQSTCDEPAGTATQRLLSKLQALYASALISSSKYDQSAAIAEQAVALGRASAGVEAETIGLFVWGQALYWKGQRLEARARMEQALQRVERARMNAALPESIAFVEWHAHVWLRGIFLSLGEYESARSHGTRALQICQALGSRFGEVHSLCNLADIARELRDLPAARQNYERALRLLPGVGYRWGEAVVQFELGDVVRMQGNYGLARDLIERGLAVAREIGNSLEEARAAAYLGRLYASLGDTARAGSARSGAAGRRRA